MHKTMQVWVKQIPKPKLLLPPLLIQCFGCMHLCGYEDRCICISSSSCIFCVGSYLYSSIGSYAFRLCRSMSWQDYAQSSCLVVDYTYVTLHVNCIVWCIKSVPEVDTLYVQDDTVAWTSPLHQMCYIVVSVFRLHAYLLLRGSMYLYFVQFVHLLCWILFVLFHWILCISPVSIHELTRLYTV